MRVHVQSSIIDSYVLVRHVYVEFGFYGIKKSEETCV